jgi:PPOX class probable F420-dependent enzyme
MRTLDPSTEAGATALRRLDTELIGWVTTIAPDGQPQSSPIWFLWRDGVVLMYSRHRAPRNDNLETSSRVSFNLNTDPDGEDVLTMEGEARIDLSRRPASADPDYLAKYGHMIERYGWTPQWFADHYSVPIVITPTRWRVA